MSARDQMIEYIGDLRVVDAILNDHARELAEKIRNSPELRDLTDDHMSDCNAAADLIDPGVTS